MSTTRDAGGRSERAGVEPFALVDPVVLERLYRLSVGSAVLAAAGGGRVLGRGADLPVEDLVDFGVGVSDAVFEVLQASLRTASAVAAPVADVVREPARRVIAGLARVTAPITAPVRQRGRRRRAEAELELAVLAQSLIPEITELVLQRIDVDEVLGQIDIQELVEASLGHVDVTAVMQRLDITEIALQHIDMNRVMDRAIKSVDVVALLRSQLEGVDMTELLIGTPTSLATGALRQTTRFVRRG